MIHHIPEVYHHISSETPHIYIYFFTLPFSYPIFFPFSFFLSLSPFLLPYLSYPRTSNSSFHCSRRRVISRLVCMKLFWVLTPPHPGGGGHKNHIPTPGLYPPLPSHTLIENHNKINDLNIENVSYN